MTAFPIASDSLILSNNDILDATATINLEQWFKNITAEELISAEIIVFRGTRILFIHPDFNTKLHNSIAQNINHSLNLEVESRSRF